MKQLILITFLLIVSSTFAADFRFEQESYESIVANANSYDDEVISIGGINLTRGELREHSTISETNLILSDSRDDSDLFMDEPYLKPIVDISLAATILHTVLSAEDDKKKHVVAGALIGAAATKICEYFVTETDNRLICALSGAGAALLAGIAKEAYDSTGRGTVDANDAIYTFIPGALVSFRFQL